MGWKLRLLGLLILLLALARGLWLLALPLILYQASPLIARLPRARLRAPDRASLAGAALITLSLAGYLYGGFFTPSLLAALGTPLLFWRRILYSPGLYRLRPIQESTLLRGVLQTHTWHLLCEAKLAGRQAAKALSGHDLRILITTRERTTILLAFQTWAPSYRRAEARLARELRVLAEALGPHGAYIMPLDSQAAARLLPGHVKPLRIHPEEPIHILASRPFQLASVRATGGFIRALGLYTQPGGGGPPLLPPAPIRPTRDILLWELLQLVFERAGAPEPDPETIFLSSLYATRAAGLDERIVEVVGPQHPGGLEVRGPGTPPIRLTRAQLRMLLKIYGPQTTP